MSGILLVKVFAIFVLFGSLLFSGVARHDKTTEIKRSRVRTDRVKIERTAADDRNESL